MQWNSQDYYRAIRNLRRRLTGEPYNASAPCRVCGSRVLSLSHELGDKHRVAEQEQVQQQQAEEVHHDAAR